MPICGLSNQWQTKERLLNDFLDGEEPEIGHRIRRLLEALDATAGPTIYVGSSLNTMNFSSRDVISHNDRTEPFAYVDVVRSQRNAAEFLYQMRTRKMVDQRPTTQWLRRNVTDVNMAADLLVNAQAYADIPPRRKAGPASMDYATARHLLLLHGPGAEDANGNPLSLDDGFLGCLRPYSGLREANFHQVMQAVLVAGSHFGNASHIDRETVRSAWEICATARRYGLEPCGMLQRNKLISPGDTAQLARWVDLIERTMLRLLGGVAPHYAIVSYAEYVAEFGGPLETTWLVALLEQAISDPETGDGGEAVVNALARLGCAAATALPALHKAELRSYTWSTPEERCTQEMRSCIRRAIQIIEEDTQAAHD